MDFKLRSLGHGLINAQPNAYGGQFYHGEVVGGMFFDARGDTPEVLDPVEEAFDVVALLIENLGEAVTMLAVNPVGNVRRRALNLDPVPDPIRVVGLVTKNDAPIRKTAQQHGRAIGVVGLAGGERQPDREPVGIGERVNFGG